MLAVKGIYENGKVILENTPKIEMSEVVFPDNEAVKSYESLDLDKKRELFDGFSGSINRIIDVKKERLFC